MAVSTKASIKSFFQAGFKPTEAQFIDFIDSYQDASEALQGLNSAAANGQKGLVRIISSATASIQAVGAVGIQLIDSTATSSALAALGGGAAGIAIFSAPTTAGAILQLGGGTVGNQLIGAEATASAVLALGTGLGPQILSDLTATSGRTSLGLGTISVQAASNVSIAGGSIVGLTTLNVLNESVALSAMDSLSLGRRIGAWINFAGDGVPSAKSSFNVSSITDVATGSYKINFTTVLSTTNHVSMMNVGSSLASQYVNRIVEGSSSPGYVRMFVASSGGGGVDIVDGDIALIVFHP